MNALKTSFSRTGAALVLVFTASGAVAIACSSDNSEPTNNPPDIGDDSGAGGSGAGGKSQTNPDASAGGEGNGETGGTTGTSNGTGGSGNIDSEGGVPDSGTGGAGGEDSGAGGAEECDPTKTGDNPKACYPCAPTKNDQFLNHCTTSDCQPFDNPARLGAANWNDGKLIPLP